MPKIYWSYEPRKHVAGNGLLSLDDSELDKTAKQLLDGTKEHLSELLGYAWAWFDITPGDFDGLDLLNAKTLENIQSGSSIAINEKGTNAEITQGLGELLAMAACCEDIALDSLCDARFSNFVSSHSLSVKLFNAFLSIVSIDADDPIDKHLIFAQAIQANCIKASNEAAKGHRLIKAKAIEMYRSGNFKSKNQASEKIAEKVNRSVAVVRAWLKGI